jgi:two-component system sensor histidine kinase UhpB
MTATPAPFLKSLSLRSRVLAAIALVLVAAAATGAAIAGLQARQSLRQELDAALLGGRQTVASAFEDLPQSDHPAQDLRQLVATFDGNRHVWAAYWPADDRSTDVSQPVRTAEHAPGWFRAWLDPRLAPVRIAVPAGVAGGGAIVLTPVAENDAGDAWRQFRGALGVFALACLCGFALVYLTIGRALKPLVAMTAAFQRVGAGDYGARVMEAGPGELVQLARSFNVMGDDLAQMRGRNAALEEQILKLQDEERAEIARDLHDEIGPHLFAVNIDAAMALQSIAAEKPAEAAQRVAAIQAAVAHMQREVKDILGRLSPARLVELGFAAAVEDLVAFWRARRPEIEFVVDLSAADDEAAFEALHETLYRVVQEALSNAMRHARAGRVSVSLARAGGELVVRVEDDGAQTGADAAVGGGRGLAGMRQRIEAAGGSLSVQRGRPRGWTVIARAPAAPPAPDGAMEARA